MTPEHRTPLLPLLLAPLLAVAGAQPAPALQDPLPFAEAPPPDDEKAKWDVSSPPGDWITIAIDTEETTWSDVDVSPDGKTVLFDMLGDIYTVPIEGGEAKALTNGIAWSFQPR